MRSQGVPSSRMRSSACVSRRRGTMPIVANTKNIEPKKKRKPSVSPLLVESCGLKRMRSASDRLPARLSFVLPTSPAACALSRPMSSLSATLMSAVCALFVLS